MVTLISMKHTSSKTVIFFQYSCNDRFAAGSVKMLYNNKPPPPKKKKKEKPSRKYAPQISDANIPLIMSPPEWTVSVSCFRLFSWSFRLFYCQAQPILKCKMPVIPSNNKLPRKQALQKSLLNKCKPRAY